VKNLIHLLQTLLMIAGSALAISGVFCGIQWLLSLVHICSAPTWSRFIWGAVGLAVLFIFLGLRGVMKHLNGQR
jgi:uncharacterized membrane protein YjfL (UPF0719 family)